MQATGLGHFRNYLMWNGKNVFVHVVPLLMGLYSALIGTVTLTLLHVMFVCPDFS